MKINNRNNTIEMSKKFAAAASRYGTTEYMDLQSARRDYPNYKVVIKKTTAKKDSCKGLTYDYMEKYIKSHDNSAGEMLSLYNEKRAAGGTSFRAYGIIKKWFLETYPDVKEFYVNSAATEQVM